MKKTENRCKICNAVIPSGQEQCDICAKIYPCHACTRSDKSACMCNKWKSWFRHQWEKFYRGHKKHKNFPKNKEKPSE